MLINRQALHFSARAAAVFVLCCSAAAASTLPNGLTPQEQALLKRFRYQVSPQPLLSGFKVTKVSADSRGYVIQYERKSDGAFVRLTGGQAGSSRAASTPSPKPKGLNAFIGGLFHHRPSSSNGIAQQGTAGEEDQSQSTGLVIDNRYTGKYTVKRSGSCLSADSDPSSAQYRSAVYHVYACNASLDEFEHLVKSQRP